MHKKPAGKAGACRDFKSKRIDYRAEMDACIRKTDYLLKRQVKGYFAPAKIKRFDELYTKDHDYKPVKEIKVDEGLIEQHFEIGSLLDGDSPVSTGEQFGTTILSESLEEINFVVPGPMSSSDYSDDYFTDIPDTITSDRTSTGKSFIVESGESELSFNTQDMDSALQKQFAYHFTSDDFSSSKEREIPIEFADDLGPTWEEKGRKKDGQRGRIGSAIIKTFNTSSSGREVVPEFIEDLFHASSATDSDDNRAVSLERISRSSSARCIKVSQSLPRIPAQVVLDPGLSILKD